LEGVTEADVLPELVLVTEAEGSRGEAEATKRQSETEVQVHEATLLNCSIKRLELLRHTIFIDY
jgi:hypothetical protein